MKTPYEWKSDFAEVAQRYIALKKQSGLKFEIQERYLRHFDTFYYGNGHEGQTLTKEAVMEFIYCKNERPVSHHNKEVVMRDFAIYLKDRGYDAYIVSIKTKLPKCKFIPRILSDNEMCRLFTAIDNYPQAKRSYRNTVDPVLFRFLYGTGVRISEALNLKLSDMDTERGIATIRAAKNRKDRLIPMADSLTKRLHDYINGFHKYSTEEMWIFPGCHNGAMGRWTRVRHMIISGITCSWPVSLIHLWGRESTAYGMGLQSNA